MLAILRLLSLVYENSFNSDMDLMSLSAGERRKTFSYLFILILLLDLHADAFYTFTISFTWPYESTPTFAHDVAVCL